mmetsp:Transcript_141445/g.246592  ORF Transcript_141445/g.246592 Transcript_141445/m.246592 type:complete len:153 (-) Transcript_141445:22-480(-)
MLQMTLLLRSLYDTTMRALLHGQLDSLNTMNAKIFVTGRYHDGVGDTKLTKLTSTEAVPLREAAFNKHEKEHQGALYPLYVRAWLARGLWRDEQYLAYCCTLLDMGARHECPFQIKTWYHLLKDSLDHCWRLLGTESSLRVSHTSRPYMEAD